MTTGTDGQATEKLLDAVASIYESALLADPPGHCLAGVATALQAQAAQVLTWHLPTAQTVDAWVSDEAFSAQNEAYVQHFSAIDPRAPALAALGHGQVLLCHEHFEEREVARCEFHQDFLLKEGMRWTAGLSMPGPGADEAMVLVVLRERGTTRFDDRAKQAMNLVAPHLRRASLLRRQLTTRESDRLDLQKLIRAIPAGCLLIDAQGRVLDRNASADLVLSELGGMLVAERVRLPHPTDQAHWRQLLARAHDDVVGQAIEFASGPRCWRAHCIPVKTMLTGLDAHDAKLLLVVFERLSEDATALAASARTRFGLTAAETEVLALLLEGFSPQAIAQRRRASTATVRTQLGSIYGKTGWRSQRALLAGLRGGVVVGP